MQRVGGLDSIRFICALWVFFGHGGHPPLMVEKDGTLITLAWRAFYGNIFSGPAAVIVFFVISGFCIHYPFSGLNQSPRLAEFYARRFLRLGIPVAIAIPISAALGIELTVFKLSILWSLVAELIYYLLYPLLLDARVRLGSWHGLIMGSFVVALGVAATDPTAGNYPSYGAWLNWLLGLPCWLLGCLLAEAVRKNPNARVSARSVWTWRAVIFIAAWACSTLRFHSPYGYPWTLNFFAILAAIWLYREVAFRRAVGAPALLEWLGTWSYSLYLAHPLAAAAFWAMPVITAPALILWAIEVGFVLTMSYVFYLAVEFPAHIIARRAARRLGVAPLQPKSGASAS